MRERGWGVFASIDQPRQYHFDTPSYSCEEVLIVLNSLPLALRAHDPERVPVLYPNALPDGRSGP